MEELQAGLKGCRKLIGFSASPEAFLAVGELDRELSREASSPKSHVVNSSSTCRSDVGEAGSQKECAWRTTLCDAHWSSIGASLSASHWLIWPWLTWLSSRDTDRDEAPDGRPPFNSGDCFEARISTIPPRCVDGAPQHRSSNARTPVRRSLYLLRFYLHKKERIIIFGGVDFIHMFI